MIGGVTRHMLPHLSGVPHLHVNSPKIPRALPWSLTYPKGLLRKTRKSRLSQLRGRRITVTTKYSENVARSSDELALCSKELCSMWSLREFEMVVSSTDRQQARRHSAEIVNLLVPQDKNEAFRSRLGYRNLRLYECRGLIQISRTSTGGQHYFCYLFCCVFR